MISKREEGTPSTKANKPPLLIFLLVMMLAAGISYAIFWPQPVHWTGDARQDRALEFEQNMAQAQAVTIMAATTVGAVLVAVVVISLMRRARR